MGKSKTIIPLAADQAYRKGHPVRIIAPPSNQAELDHSLYHYFAEQGIEYRRLNIFEKYVPPMEGGAPGKWWTEENLNEILEMVQQNEPLGISTKDVQLLKILKEKLNTKLKSKMDELKTTHLSGDDKAKLEEEVNQLRREVAISEKIVDLLQYSGLNIFDEYGPSVMPGRIDELHEPATEMGWALKPLNTQPTTTREIVEVQSAFLSASKNKICLSATMGTGFAMAALTQSATVAEAAAKCVSDPKTTDARFLNWLAKARPILSRGTSKPEDRIRIIGQAMEGAGKDKQIILFDGNDDGKNRFENVKSDHENLKKARGGVARGLLYYNDQKNLCLYHPQDKKYQGENATVTPEMETLIRNHPEDYDVRLDSTQGVGTDCPQSAESMGIHFGFLEDASGRSSVTLQQVGRSMRKSGSLKMQNLFMVMDPSTDPDKACVSEDVREKHKGLVTAYERAQADRDKAWKQLASALNIESAGELSLEQRRVIHSVLHVTPPDKDGSYEDNLAHDLDAYINSWECDVFPKDRPIVKALKDFKSAQRLEQDRYLDMVGGVMALREKSEPVKAREEDIASGVKRSEAEGILFGAHAWREEEARTVLERVRLDSVLTPGAVHSRAQEYDHDVYVDEFEKQLRAAVHKELKEIERERFEDFDKDVPLETFANSSHMDSEIKACISRLQERGITPDSQVKKTEIPPELMNYCNELKKTADDVYENLGTLCNYGKQSEKVTKSDGTLVLSKSKDWKKIKKLHEDLNKKFTDLQAGDLQALTEFCRERDSALEIFYHGLATQLSGIEFKSGKLNSNGPKFGKMCEILEKGMGGLNSRNFVNTRDRINRLYPSPNNNPTRINLVKSGKANGWNWRINASGPDGQAKVEYDSLDKMRNENSARQMAITALGNGKDPLLVASLEHIKGELLKDNRKYRDDLTDLAIQSQDRIDRREKIKLQ
ncbi:hypothetical protein [Endozoicomonas sp. SCSIO W0465]|uniref:hypothetical protein n=1 Tax=Endozoicomonas sp. SCSIO W0465 TaxID=2918516 RepID=UPI002075F2CB|nr:hypothetical protein [Endozoicomonas sp. SCSIO W0465]USE34983.1 hypothetical protein MJO57_23105 [Endozoicomonas sp. SCSIO W0465]